MTVHASSVLGEDVVVTRDLEVGPFCVVGVDGGADAPPLQLGQRSLLRSHVVVYRGTTIGDGFHAAHHVLVREHTTVGDDVSIGSGSVVEHHVVVGNGVRLHSRCFVPEHSVIEAGAWLGPGVILTNARYPNRPDTKSALEGVVVEEAAVLGAGVVVLPGVRIGRGALVGAGAVVVCDVEPGETVVGNPARAAS